MIRMAVSAAVSLAKGSYPTHQQGETLVVAAPTDLWKTFVNLSPTALAAGICKRLGIHGNGIDGLET